MTHRQENPQSLIVDAVIATKGPTWGGETRKVARSDAQRVLEAMIAEFGVERAVDAAPDCELVG